MPFLGLSLLLILLGLFVAGLHVLVTVGIIVLIVGAVCLVVPGSRPYGRWPW